MVRRSPGVSSPSLLHPRLRPIEASGLKGRVRLCEGRGGYPAPPERLLSYLSSALRRRVRPPCRARLTELAHHRRLT